MRRAVVVILMVCASAAHAGPPTVDDAIAHAAVAKKPLVLDIGAAWCKPCRELDKVFERPEIRQLLGDIELVRYDVDVAPGDAAAARFNVHAFPTLIVVAADGTEVTRRSGYLGRDALAKFLMDARDHALSTADLEAAVAAHPDDVTARAKLAAHYRAIARVPDAIEQYRTIVQQAGPDRTAIARAAAAIDDITAAESRVKTVVDAALAFVDTYPESPLASQRLALLAASRRVEKLQLDDLARRHLAAVPPEAFAEAFRTALVVGATAEAEHAMAAITAPTPQQRLLAAELALRVGGRDLARRIVADVCRGRPADLELVCLVFDEVLDMPTPIPPGALRIAMRAKSVLAALENPGAERETLTLSMLADVDAVYGNALSKMLREAIDRCAPLAKRPMRAMFFIEESHVHVYATNDADLRSCLEHGIVLKELPPAPPQVVEDGVSATLTIDPRRRPATPIQIDHALVRNVQVVVYGVARSSGAPSPDFAVRGAVDILHFGEAWLTSTFEGELGSGDSSNVRAALGLRFGRQHPDAGIAILAGWGRTHFGDVAPAATEFAIEMRGTARRSNAAVQFWLRTSRLLGSTSDARMHLSSDAFSPDEMSGGIGFSLPVVGYHLYGGFAYEHRHDSDDYVIEVGIPILDRF